MKGKIISQMTIPGTAKVVCIDMQKEDVDFFLRNNTHNRNIIKTRVEILKKSIEMGQWKFNGATIVIDSNGVLLDGQTRLTAIAKSGYPITRQLIVILESSQEEACSVQKTIDKGTARTYSQNLFLDNVKNVKANASIRRAIYSITNQTSKACCEHVLDNIGRDYKDEIEILIRYLQPQYLIRLCSSHIAAIAVVAHRNKERMAEIADMIDDVCSCSNIEKESTKNTLMRLVGSKIGRAAGNVMMETSSKIISIIEEYLRGNTKMTKVYGVSSEYIIKKYGRRD